MLKLIKTKSGRKFHVATGAHIHCGMYGNMVEVVTGEVEKSSVCGNCTKGMDVSQFGISGVTFVSGGRHDGA